MTVPISFEFFPPRTPNGRKTLLDVAAHLARFKPTFYSVTYGAGGSTRGGTAATVKDLREAGHAVAPHLSWAGDTEAQLLATVRGYVAQGVDRLVALRGDTPSGIGSPRRMRHAEELVRLIRTHIRAPLVLEVAAYPEVHPEAASAAADIQFLKRKVDAGANGCITQYFYNADAYLYFRDRCEAAGIGVPIVPGIMPITNAANLARFSERAGAEIPRWLQRRLDELADDHEALTSFGADVVTALCERLIAGDAPGLHFYTLNKAAPTAAIVARL